MLRLSDGRTLDDVFEPYDSGTKECPAGEMFINGQDIRDRYAPLSTGEKAPDVNYHIDNVDITNYFAEIGTVSTWIVPESWNGASFFDGGVEGTGGRIILRVNHQGTVTVFTGINTTYKEYERNPIPANVSTTNVEVRCIQNSGEGAISNTLLNWVPLNGSTSNAGEVEYRLTVVNEHIGNFTLEFREISNNAEGTTGDFTFRIKVIEQPIL